MPPFLTSNTMAAVDDRGIQYLASVASNVEQPFACTYPQCGARFKTEPQLRTHLSHHEHFMEPTQTSDVLPMETPTPTRVLEMMELFGPGAENVNVFEQGFRERLHAQAQQAVQNGQVLVPESPMLPSVSNAVSQDSPAKSLVYNTAATVNANNIVKSQLRDHVMHHQQAHNPLGVTNTQAPASSESASKNYSQSQPVSPRESYSGSERPSQNDERRQKFLERNRAAASRCRAKKKVWINDLEQKASDLQKQCAQYMTENARLKEENAKLKELLLQHSKNCQLSIMP
eukprot:Colp12_sorted_trinity150504_noHs@29543